MTGVSVDTTCVIATMTAVLLKLVGVSEEMAVIRVKMTGLGRR
jgi:hypothetical protein